MAKYEPGPKQHKVHQYLTGHPEIRDLLIGGGAGGAKSYTAAAWIIMSALKYPNTFWFVGRETLESIKGSILKTFKRILKDWGVEYKMNYSSYVMSFANGSEVMFKQLQMKPGNPEFDQLGSYEFTGAYIEEAQQVCQQAAEVLATRIRYRLEEYGLSPKLLMSCNPSKNWLRSEYYLPWTKGELKPHRYFIPLLASDNKHVEKSYVNNLGLLDEQNRKRLLDGNWDYDDSDQALFSWDILSEAFESVKYRDDSEERKYITVDPAGQGKDKAVIMVWYGYHVEDIITFAKSTTTEIADEIKAQMAKHKIREHKIAIDIDGGTGVKDQVSAFCQGINNGATPFRNENYRNLKTQMYFKMAEMLPKISFAPHLKKYKDIILQEVYAHKRTNIDSDSKIEMTKKDQVKKDIGRSPDFADALAYRFFWPCKNKWNI